MASELDWIVPLGTSVITAAALAGKVIADAANQRRALARLFARLEAVEAICATLWEDAIQQGWHQPGTQPRPKSSLKSDD